MTIYSIQILLAYYLRRQSNGSHATQPVTKSVLKKKQLPEIRKAHTYFVNLYMNFFSSRESAGLNSPIATDKCRCFSKHSNLVVIVYCKPTSKLIMIELSRENTKVALEIIKLKAAHSGSLESEM